MNELRQIELETKVAYHEIAIEELRTALHEQYRIIEKLESSLTKVSDRLRAYESHENPVGPASEKPPHY